MPGPEAPELPEPGVLQEREPAVEPPLEVLLLGLAFYSPWQDI